MKVKISILYSWLVRTFTLLLPNVPVFMRFRGFLYSLMMKSCGKNFQITSSAILNSLTGISVGNDVYIAHNVVIIGLDVTIGNEVLVGPGCLISSGNHVYQDGSYRFGRSAVKPVVIMDGCWVAGNCAVTGGSVLPARSILAAGAVLNKSYTQADYLYAGIPSLPIKQLR